MSLDADLMLLDRVFQPVADRLSPWATCFDLARTALVVAIVLHTVVLAWDLAVLSDALLIAVATGGTLLGYRAASQMRLQIARAERRSRSGVMNVQRILLRPFRLAWIVIAGGSAALMLSSAPQAMDWCHVALSAFWLAAAYLASCSPAPPVVRGFRWGGLSPAGAG